MGLPGDEGKGGSFEELLRGVRGAPRSHSSVPRWVYRREALEGEPKTSKFWGK